MFDPFSRVEGTTSPFAGTGIGLSLVHSLVTAMGGTCGVESELGRGSTFWFRLAHTREQPAHESIPVTQEDWLVEENAPTAVSATLRGVAHGEGRPVILVVDDVDDMRELVCQTLDRAGYATIQSADGASGLAKAMGEMPDLVLLDWMMPGLSGRQFLLKMRSDPTTSGIPVVMLTARSDWESRLQAAEMGSDAFLGKPFNQREMLSTVRNLLKLKEGERELTQANQALEEFVHIVTHDLKSPAHTIAQFATLLDDTLPPDRDSQITVYLSHIENLSNRMLKMIADLLNYARARNRPPVFEDVPLTHCLTEAREQLAGQLAERGANVLSDELPVVRGCWTLWTEVFQNLIGNGVKYNQSKVPQVSISVVSETDKWVLTFRDNGIGIPANEAKNIFKPFSRLHAASEYEGTGLGLAFCKQVVEHHGGKIWLGAREHGGTEVCVSIPNLGQA